MESLLPISFLIALPKAQFIAFGLQQIKKPRALLDHKKSDCQ